MLVAAGVGGVLADVLPLVGHLDVRDLDGGAGQGRGFGGEADPPLLGRRGVVGPEAGVEHGYVDPLPILGLVDPGYLEGKRLG